MALPLSRNTTYTAGSQVKSDDLNDLQDSIIALHSEHTLVIPASAFTGDVDSTLTQFGYRTLSAVGFLYAPIPLQVGKRIKSVTVYYDPQSSGAIIPRLSRRTLASGAKNYIWEGVSDNTGSGIESQTGSALDYTMLATEAYEIEVAIAGANNRLYYATVVYDEP